MSKKLTPTAIKGNKAGKYAGRDGLVLVIRETAKGVSKSWRFIRTVNGTAHEVTLGAVAKLDWEMAQALATRINEMVLAGKSAKAALAQATSSERFAEKMDMTLNAVVDRVWREKYLDTSSKNAFNWLSGLRIHILPKFGERQVHELTLTEMHQTWVDFYRLRPGQANTCIKTLERFIYCLSQARRMLADKTGDRDSNFGIDLSKWQDERRWLIANGLPNDATPQQDSAQRSFPSIHYLEVAQLWPLYKPDQISDLALQFQSLTVSRSGALLSANWDEVDWSRHEWCIPAGHLKVKDRGNFVIPLSDTAMEVLERVKKITGDNELIFTSPRSKTGAPLTSAALNQRLVHLDVRAKCGRYPVAHGFRSTFTKWADEKQSGLSDEIKWCKHHKFWNATDDSYRDEVKATLFLAKRRVILSEWAEWLTGRNPEANNGAPDTTDVVNFAARAKNRA
jgi:integrase